MKRPFTILACLAYVAMLGTVASGNDDPIHAGHNEISHRHASDPLVEEMVKLDDVFRDVVSGVALGDGVRVHDALEKMHGTMEKTHEGIHHGTVTLKKNGGRLNDFIGQDRQFHAQLELLSRAAQRNDQTAMASLTKELLDRCIACHRDFRQP